MRPQGSYIPQYMAPLGEKEPSNSSMHTINSQTANTKICKPKSQSHSPVKSNANKEVKSVDFWLKFYFALTFNSSLK